MSNGKKTTSRTVRAQADEARGTTPRWSIKYHGHTYHIPQPEQWDIEALEAMADLEDNPAKSVSFIRALLGTQWQSFKDRERIVKNFEGFVRAVMERVEKDAGDDAPN